MSKNIWDIFAPVYEFAMRSQKNIYDCMYERIGGSQKGKTCLSWRLAQG